jgi:serine/threonine-protein kinase HipA
MQNRITFERFTGGQWIKVGGTKLLGDPGAGIGAPSATAYLIDYAVDHLDRRDAAALSAALPVSLDEHRLPRWPAFLVDLLPQGFGRAELLRRLELPAETGREADWQLLLAGAGNPIGHLRVGEAYAWLQERAGGRRRVGWLYFR